MSFLLFDCVCCSVDKSVRLWHADERTLLARIDLDQEARTAAFSPDGNRAAVGLANGNVAVLKVKDLSTVQNEGENEERE